MKAKRIAMLAAGLAIVSMVGACDSKSTLPPFATFGPNPTLVDPQHRAIPTVKIAKVVGWGPGAAPVAAAGLKVAAFANGLSHPRWMLVLPNGDVLLAQTDGPGYEKPSGIRGFAQKLLMKNAGAGTPSPNNILLLRDTNGDGVADVRQVLVSGLNSPFGMAFVGGRLYVADTDAILSWPYELGQMQLTGRAKSSPTCLAAPSTITGPRTSCRAPTGPSSMRPSARTATSATTAPPPR